MEYGLNLDKYNLTIDRVCTKENVLKRDKCDKYDYLISACSGMVAGLVDAFFVGTSIDPKNPSHLMRLSDATVDKMVMSFAKKMGWKPVEGKNTIASAIGFLERNFKVNYDQAHTKAVNDVFNMAAKNHHMKSLGHSPSVVGLFFSILDQFSGTSHFINNGKLISIDTNTQNLSGSNFHSKLFCGFVNWIGHLMSDVAGSSGARGNGNRGSGLVIPFTELFQFCNFGTFKNSQEKLTFANVMVKVFEKGYDFRFGMAMAIPVVLNELFIRVFWVVKRRFYKNVEWKDCIPTEKHADLRIMLLIGNTMLCVVDGLDALIRSDGSIVKFITRLNIIAWVRLIILVFKELKIRYGSIAIEMLKEFIKSAVCWGEEHKIREFYNRISVYDNNLRMELIIFVEEVEKETKYIKESVNYILDSNTSHKDKNAKTIELARHTGVEENKILKNTSEIDDFFLK